MVTIESLVEDLRPYAEYLDRSVFQSGLQGRFTSTLRSRAEQERLYRKYISGGSPFPAAPPGFSAHEYGEAFDYVVSPYEYQADVGAFWRSLGGTWGGDRDPVHFELPGAAQRAAAAGKAQLDQAIANGDRLPWWADVAQIFLPLKAADLSGGHGAGYKSYIEQLADEFLKSRGI